MKNFQAIIFLIFIIVGSAFFGFLSVKDYSVIKKIVFFQPAFPTPNVIQALYLTNYSASNSNKIDEIIKISDKTGINAVIIDIKDWSGYIDYETKIPQADSYKSKRVLIPDLKRLIDFFHSHDIYTIARIVVFQDPVLAQARPEIAVQRKSNKNKLWLNYSGLAWVDPASKEVWDYHVALARDVAHHGFDEINFDYIRFPSDGNLAEMHFPVWDKKKSRHEVIKTFYKYLRKNLSDLKISADLFGYTTVHFDDLGIGQIIEDAYPYFDFICPMSYPDYYSPGFLGFEEPGNYPYEVVHHSILTAQKRLEILSEDLGQDLKTKIRPWIQGFSYEPNNVHQQILAIQDALGKNYNGFLIWNPRNVYNLDFLR